MPYVHVVVLKLKPDATAEQKASILDGLAALPSPAHADVLRVCTERGLDYRHASFTCYAHGSADGAPSPGTTHSAPH